jgi:hypothetical protein
MQELPNALVAFAAFKQFIVYKSVPSVSRPGKTDKYPVDHRTGHFPVSAHDPQYWLDSETAIRTAGSWGEPFGVGFVFTEQDPFWFLDIDGCLQADGQWNPVSQQLSGLLSGCAVEISQSGKGLHFFGIGRPPAHGCRNDAYGLEFYHAGRFAALTGIGAIGNAACDASSILPALIAAYFPPDASQGISQEWTTEPDPLWNGPANDEELIRRAMNSRSSASAFGSRASFSDLWMENVPVLAQSYPDAGGRPYDASAADAALAQHLAFWTGKNCERIRTIMFGSKLVREKWDREGNFPYLQETILRAVARQSDVLTDKRMEPLPMSISATVPNSEQPQSTTVQGITILDGEKQVELFNGAVYISDQHKALIPGGRLLKPEQFKVHYGGYSFQIDPNNERLSRDAWEAWTQSQLYRCPRVDGSCFRPDMPPGAVLVRGGQRFVNTYFPVNVERKQGDPGPFLGHLKKLLPNEHDRQIILSYMAACVQHKGVKFQWAPLIQGVEGNGKTLLTRCVAEAVGRRYVHWPKASKLSKEFNAWMVGKLFFAVEDIYVPDARREVIEDLKPLITGGDGLEIEAKGVDQTSADICGNFIFNSNHLDAIRKTKNDRRFCVLFSSQQQVEDLTRDGMEGNYFPQLYDWLRAEGYAIVNELLSTYQIPAAYNPAGQCQRAPNTSSTEQAIASSTGSVEQEIQESVAQGLPGFNGGWVSSIYLDRLLERMGLMRRVSHTKRKEMLAQLGYKPHPALPDGRVNNAVLPDGGKPRLYIKEGSLALQITVPAEVAKAYETANANRSAAVTLPFIHHQRG